MIVYSLKHVHHPRNVERHLSGLVVSFLHRLARESLFHAMLF